MGQGKGQGKGKMPEIDTDAQNKNPLQLQGQNFKGKTIAEIQFFGESDKGQSTATYQEYTIQKASEANTGLSEKKIPKEYHDDVRKYFDDIQEKK